MSGSGSDIAWALGRRYMGWPARAVTRPRAYGRERVPKTGGLVYAVNHMHWIDIPLVGALSPRNIDFVAKVEAVGPSGYVTDLSLLENRYQFQRYLKDVQSSQPGPSSPSLRSGSSG